MYTQAGNIRQVQNCITWIWTQTMCERRQLFDFFAACGSCASMHTFVWWILCFADIDIDAAAIHLIIFAVLKDHMHDPWQIKIAPSSEVVGERKADHGWTAREGANGWRNNQIRYNMLQIGCFRYFEWLIGWVISSCFWCDVVFGQVLLSTNRIRR